MNKVEVNLDFLRYCINPKIPLPDNVHSIDWKRMMGWAEQQAIVGVIYQGILRADKDIQIPFDILMQWIGYAQRIEMQNRLLNKRCVEVVKEYNNAGFQCCVLKGQGNATLYDVRCKKEDGKCMALLRQPGDIDIWVYAKADGKSQREEVVAYVKREHPEAEVRYYHIEYMDSGVPVEVHFKPGIMNNPVYNRRLQTFYGRMADEGFMMAELPDGVGEIPVPTEEFNIVFQLAHMMHHFFDEGIGLRQMIDYYYLLHSAKDDVRGKMSDVRETLKYLNLYKFAGAVMYIMKEVLGLDEKYLIVPVDEKRGRTLLKEILKGGNFGQHSGLTQHSTGMKYFLKTKRNFKLAYEYPTEAFCEPFFRTWHFFWRMCYK